MTDKIVAVLDVMVKLERKYGPKYILRLVSRYSLVLSDPKDVEVRQALKLKSSY